LSRDSLLHHLLAAIAKGITGILLALLSDECLDYPDAVPTPSWIGENGAEKLQATNRTGTASCPVRRLRGQV
ncbi:hypothetical protein, partial [Thauera sinica]